VEQPLPSGGWQAGIIEQVSLDSSFLELHISIAGSRIQRVHVNREILDRYGLTDASSLAERTVFLRARSDAGSVELALGARRVDFGHSSLVQGQNTELTGDAEDSYR
jgi:hypothetical protein